jgi:hypothetical protein
MPRTIGIVRLEGQVEVRPYAVGSKSERQHQVFLVTPTGERLLLRRYDGPPMRDTVLEALAGQSVVAVGERHDRLFIATDVRPATPAVKARGSEKAASTSGGKPSRKR